MLALLAVWLSAAVPVPAVTAQKPKLAVLELSPGAGVDASETGPLTEAATSEVQRRGFFEVMSQRDISTMLGLERQKQLLGCSEESSSCLAELSGALGARFVMTGTVARLGDAYQLTLNTLDTQKTQPLGRSTRLAKDLGALQAQLPAAVAEATATPLPPPPSRLKSYLSLGAGAAALVAGVAVGLIALSAQGQLSGELGSATAQRAGTLTHDRAYYEQQVAEVQRNKYIALGCLLAGAVFVTLGIVLWPKDDGGAQLTLVPTLSGGALVGAF